MSIFVVVVFLCFCVSFFLSSFMFVCASLSGQFPSHQLTLSQLLSLSSLTQQNAFRFSTLELDYTLPKEKEKNGMAASADPPRRSKKARTQPKSELSALPPPPPHRVVALAVLCVLWLLVVQACSGPHSASRHDRKVSAKYAGTAHYLRRGHFHVWQRGMIWHTVQLIVFRWVGAGVKNEKCHFHMSQS